MVGQLRIHTANWLTGGIHVLILYGAIHAESAAVWPFALGAMSLVSFAAWIGNYRRLRHIADTPLSNIATAAQGYVEIAGIAEMPGGTPVISKLSLTPCVWYQYEVFEKNSKDEWVLEDSGASDDPFVIRDKGGHCVIDPDGAEIVCSRERTWTQGSYRYREWLLLPREQVYALGKGLLSHSHVAAVPHLLVEASDHALVLRGRHFVHLLFKSSPISGPNHTDAVPGS